MDREEVRRLAGREALKDWRFWVTYLISVFLFSNLVVFFFQIDSPLVELGIIFAAGWMFDTILKNHYTNAIAAEKGIKLD